MSLPQCPPSSNSLHINVTVTDDCSWLTCQDFNLAEKSLVNTEVSLLYTSNKKFSAESCTTSPPTTVGMDSCQTGKLLPLCQQQRSFVRFMGANSFSVFFNSPNRGPNHLNHTLLHRWDAEVLNYWLERGPPKWSNISLLSGLVTTIVHSLMCWRKKKKVADGFSPGKYFACGGLVAWLSGLIHLVPGDFETICWSRLRRLHDGWLLQQLAPVDVLYHRV